jgi:hypothetical protein
MAMSTSSWEALQRAIAGEVVLPGSPAYEELPKPFNARFHDVRPQAIVLCATPQDVSETIWGGPRWPGGCGQAPERGSGGAQRSHARPGIRAGAGLGGGGYCRRGVW